MLTQNKNTIALKEWAATIKAIEMGEQSILFRKGGIIEKHNVFELEAEEFFLYPTFLHQEASRIAPEHQHYLETAKEYRLDEKTSLVKLKVKVTQITKPNSFEELLNTLPKCIWSKEHLEKIWFWKPEKPCYVLTIKKERLEQPLKIEDHPDYEGCFSWINLQL